MRDQIVFALTYDTSKSVSSIIPTFFGVYQIGVSATLEIPSSTPFSVMKFGLIPGYLKSDKTWIENNRIKKGLLVIYSPPPQYNPKNEWVVYRLNFKNKKGLQIFELLDNKRGVNMDPMTKTLWFKIEEVYKGTKYNDTCISEVVIGGGCLP